MPVFATRFKSLLLKKQARDDRTYTQEQIADATDLSPATVARVMAGDVDTTNMKTMGALCQWLDCDLGELAYVIGKGDQKQNGEAKGR